MARENFSIVAFYNTTKNQENPIKTVERDSFFEPQNRWSVGREPETCLRNSQPCLRSVHYVKGTDDAVVLSL